MSDVLEGEELVASLRQLVISFRPYIREAGSAEQAEEALLHMEEINENFHRYMSYSAFNLSLNKSEFLLYWVGLEK